MADAMMDATDAKGDGGNDITGNQKDETDARGQARLPRMTEAEFLSDKYTMNHNNRGVAVIFNNTTFVDRPKWKPRLRNGDSKARNDDSKAVKEMLVELGFKDILEFKDKTVANMKYELEEVSKLDHKNNDCLVCVILTCGEEGNVFGTDDKVPVDELIQPFKGNRCPDLVGKPKIFFIQACKNSMLDLKKDVADDAESESMNEVNRSIPAEADVFVAYSVIPATLGSNGSWFIQTLADVIKKNWRTMDLMTMMTRVMRKVAQDFEKNHKDIFVSQARQIPYITSMLTKNVYFSRGVTV